jgi:hypothetical protein
MSSEDVQEWDQLAHQYHLIFKPKFQPIYDYIARVCKRLNSQSILDYATGPGEPGTTLFSNGFQVTCADFSPKMLSQIQQVKKVLLVGQSISELGQFDTIINSLGLMYMEKTWLKEAFDALPLGGILITAHWPHPNLVPMLKILKQSNCKLKNEDKDLVYLETQDATFSMWNESQTRSLFSDFEILEYVDIDVSMEFQDAKELMSFSGHVGDTLDRASAYCTELVKEHLGSYQEPFVLENKCTIVVCRKN